MPVAHGGTGGRNAGEGLNNLLPAQTGHAGQVLPTDGTSASRQTAVVVTSPAVVTGSRTDGTALASLPTALANLGLIGDQTTA